jgi:sugar/nucleoside kinase (ribokinase family)
MTTTKKNIFIIGDLVIDHTIFVKEPEMWHPTNTASPTYEVVRRLDTAGGAATCARILAVLNPGHTFLWGLIGKSHWGDFRSILEQCQLIDGSYSNIKFRGVQDETHAQMNTVTRLLRPDPIRSYDPPTSIVRFEDYGHVHVSEDKRQTIMHYLDRVHQKYTLDGIILNDLDMNCLKADLIKKIADFAGRRGISLFVNPKHERDKYADIEGDAIISSLSEWCHLVGQSDRFKYWQERLDRDQSLKEMAQLSFQHLGNFHHHIIECGENGAVLMTPHLEKSDRYAVYRVGPHETQMNSYSPHFGCGEIMTAVFALEFSATERTTRDAIQSYLKANATLACYRDMPWQRMPPRAIVLQEQGRITEPSIKAEPSKGLLFLPKDHTIMLSDPKHETQVPGLFSVDASFRSTIEAFMNDVKRGLDPGDPKSIILGAPSASGKTTILEALAGELGAKRGVELSVISEIDKVGWDKPREYFRTLLETRDKKSARLLFAIDEAMKPQKVSYLEKYGVDFLNEAHAHGVRFLFIDATFEPDSDLSLTSEFTSRCVAYHLPGLSERPVDIPFIVAGMVFDMSEKDNHNFNSLKFAGNVLLAITNATLQNPNLRKMRGWVNSTYHAAIKSWTAGDSLSLTLNHLSTSISDWGKQSNDIDTGIYEFYKAGRGKF